MKKNIFAFLCLFFVSVPSAFAALTISKEIPDSSVSDIGYFHKGNCKTERNFKASSDDWLVVSDRGALQNFTVAYKVDGGKCSDIGSSNDTICVAGLAQFEQKTYKNTCFHANRAWAGSWAPGNDTWELDAQAPLPDCQIDGKSWTAAGPDKIAVFVKNNNSVITTTSGKPVRSLNTPNVVSNYNVKCIAYVCVDAKNNITYGNADGSCGQGSNSNTKYRNTVKPYLDALGNCATAK